MSGQRDKAKKIACACPPGSLGRDAICPNFARVPFWLGNACAGDVGDLYERKQKDLEQSATDLNIARWAVMETAYFQTQGGCTARLASIYSAKEREQMMKDARDGSRK